MRATFALMVIAIAAGFAPQVHAATYNARKTNSPPTIDGVIDDAEWLDAARVGDWSLLRTANNPDTENSQLGVLWDCLLYTSPSPRDATLSRMPSSA